MESLFVFNLTSLLSSLLDKISLNRFLRVMGLVVVGVYLAIGSLLIFTDYFTIIAKEYRAMAGYAILAYGLLRGTRYILGNRNTKKS
jgi:hypothetical protein